MSKHIDQPALTKFSANIADNGYISAADVLQLRTDVFRNGVVDMTEAEELFSMADIFPNGAPEWPVFFKEALTDYFAHQAKPEGYISQNDAGYLIGRLGPAASLDTTKFGFLIHLLQNAKSSPQDLLDYAFTVTHARILADGSINAEEVQNLQIFLFAAGGEDNVAISRTEAELMFDLNDAAKSGKNAPEWAVLFKQVIANYLMAHIGYTPASREEMLKTEAALQESPKGIFAMLSGIAKGKSRPNDTDSVEDIYAQRNAAHAVSATAATNISFEDADWLAARIGKDGEFDIAERSALQHLKILAQENGAELPQKLKALTDQAA